MESCESQITDHVEEEDAGLETPECKLAAQVSYSNIESPIEVIDEDNSNGNIKRNLDVQKMPVKAMTQNQVFDNNDFNPLLSDNESSCSSYESLTSERRIEVQKSLPANGLMEYVPASENKYVQSTALSRRPQNEVWRFSRAESNLVQTLRRQIERLALKEQDVQRTLSNERIENLVAKVEEEVEFEGMVEDLCMRFKAEGEFMDIERRERDWERERREVRLEEEVEVLQKKVEFLEQEIRIARSERDCALKKQIERYELIDDGKSDHEPYADPQRETENSSLVQKDYQELSDGGGENSPTILKGMLRQAEEDAERDRKLLEHTFQEEQQVWIENEQRLHNQISILEKEVNYMRVMLKEKESALSLERERRRQYGLEIDKILAYWREENSVYNSVCQRLKLSEGLLSKSLEKMKNLKALYQEGETDISGLVSEVLNDLETAETEQLDMSSLSAGQKHLEWELVAQWKSQRDHLEEERDRLQEKLDLTTEMAKDNQEKMERIWEEKEAKLVKQLRNLETIVSRSTASSRSTILKGEKETIDKEIIPYFQGWQEEEERVLVMLAEREQLMKEHSQEWSSVLDAKEEELCALKSTQKRLINSLKSSKKQLLNLKRQLARHRRGITKDSVSKDIKASPTFNAVEELCSDESDFETGCSTDLSITKEHTKAVGNNEEDYLDVQQLATDISKEIGRLARELRREQDRLEKERIDVRMGTQQLKDERKELETKVADTLCLMEDLREQIKVKEGQMEWQRKQMDLILNAKEEEIQQLKTLLETKDLDIEKNIKKFKDDMQLIEKEVEKERKERENVMDMHFSSRRKLVQEMKEKEVRWEKEIEEMSQDMEHLRREIDEKNQVILKLKKDLRDSELNAEQSLIKQVERCDLINGPEEMPSDYARTCSALTKPGSIQSNVFGGRRDVEWQDLISKIAGFDNQIAEAMLAIQSLKEELNAKEKELQKARLEQESGRKATWIHEGLETKTLEEPSKMLERIEGWDEREHLFSRDNEDLIKLLEEERADTSDAMSTLQGAVRELQWALKHSQGKEFSSFELDKKGQNLSLKGELVKVHASHLEELDAYILELKLKVEEAERRARAAEVALAVNAVKEAARNKRPVSSLMRADKEWAEKARFKEEDEDSPASTTSRGWAGGDLRFQAQSPSRRQPSIEKQGSRSLGHDYRNSQPSRRWSGVSLDENTQLWDVGASSPRLDLSSNSTSSKWMTVRGVPDESLAIQDSFQQAPMTPAVSTPPARGQRRWLVDANWLDNVRKEQSFLKQQLDMEKQRVSALKQVEVEKRWLEATIVETLEQKKESDARVMELEQKVAFLESMINKKGFQERPPLSSPFYKGARF